MTETLVLLHPQVWLLQPQEVRMRLAEVFGLTKSGGNSVTTDNGKTRIDSDGHTTDDLRKISVDAMREYTGSSETSFWPLWDLTVAKARQSLETPPPEEMTTDELPPAAPGVEIPVEKVHTSPKPAKKK